MYKTLVPTLNDGYLYSTPKSKIIAILKTDKSNDRPEKYHPIALLSVLRTFGKAHI